MLCHTGGSVMIHAEFGIRPTQPQFRIQHSEFISGGVLLQSKWKTALAQGLMSYLFSLGMALTILGVTGLLEQGMLAAITLAGVTAVTALASTNRRVALGSGCAALFVVCVWLLIGGAGLTGEVLQALLLHMSGLTTALPMVAVPFTVMICLMSVAASWFVTQRSAGAFPALILLMLAAVLLWLGNWPEVLICLLPAAVACVTLLLRAGDERTSTFRVLPLAVVVTSIAFAGVASGGVVSEPLKNLADSIRQRIYDTFFYTQPRDVFTLATEGYYPQGMSQLGGPATPHEEPVMAVITPRKTYLRGVIKNVYTGRTWLEQIGGRRYLFSAARFEELRNATFDQSLPVLDGMTDASVLNTRTLQVRMLRDSASTLFAPQRIRSVSAEGDLIPYFNASSEIFATSNLEPGDVWTMEAALFTANDSGMSALVHAADSAADENWQAVCDNYLQLHDDIDQRVYDMAAQAISGANTPFEQAMALQHYLAANYTYSLAVEMQPSNQDFVSTFLIETKKGYCTYFATAMTVMCRMVGLPARYVEGYVAYPDAEGLAIVTGQEGHAWTEVYFRGFGWVTFDATPTSVEYTDYSGNLPDENSGNPDSEQTPEPSQEPQPTPTPAPTPEDAPTPTPEPQTMPENESAPQPSDQPSVQEKTADRQGNLPWLAWVLLLLALLVVIRALLVQPGVQARRSKNEYARWLVWMQAVHDVLRCHGLIRERAESPAAFFSRAEHSGKVGISLQALADAENLMFYGHAEPMAEETVMARECFMALYRQMKAGQKCLFQLKRVCLPGKRFDFTVK